MKESMVDSQWWGGLVPLHYGYEKCERSHSYGPAIRGHYLIHYVFSGKGRYLVKNETYDISCDDIFIIRSDDVALYQASESDPWTYAWIGFSAPEGIDFLNSYTYHVPSLKHCFEQLRELNNMDACVGDVYIILYRIITELYKLFGSTKKDEINFAIRLRMLIETNYMRAISIQEFSDSMHINRHYLSQLFKEQYGMAPKAFLTRVRLEKASLLISQGYGVGEAASMVGISDISNFSRMFKKHFGYCPRQATEKNESIEQS